jgi:hypothetical protein
MLIIVKIPVNPGIEKNIQALNLLNIWVGDQKYCCCRSDRQIPYLDENYFRTISPERLIILATSIG